MVSSQVADDLPKKRLGRYETDEQVRIEGVDVVN
jgi:hypothetical protein